MAGICLAPAVVLWRNFVPADHVTSAEEKLARRMSLTWSRFARNPFGQKGGWGDLRCKL